MKIGVASEGKMVSGHFGHCESFSIYQVEDGEIKDKQIIENPGHRPGFLPNFLNEKGINVMILGGIGQKAKMIFEENGIEVVAGVSGEVEDAVKAYLAGDLESDDSVCHEHMHHGDCGNH